MAADQKAAELRAESCPDPVLERAARLAATIDQWFVAHFYNSPVSRSTEAFNHAFAAKEALKRQFIEEV